MQTICRTEIKEAAGSTAITPVLPAAMKIFQQYFEDYLKFFTISKFLCI
jgi:hypothetical protein